MEKVIVKNFEEIINYLTQEGSPIGEVSITTDIERKYASVGFPVKHKYAPQVSIKYSNKPEVYLNLGEGRESPDKEFVECYTKCEALDAGIIIAKEISDYEGIPNSEKLDIKVNNLSLDMATSQLEIYKKELDKIQKEHANYIWM